MMSSSTPQPPPLPVTVASAAAAPADPAPPAIAVRQFLSRLADSGRAGLSNCRPWGELLDRSAFSRPDSVADAASRVRKNLAYFRVNYLAVVAAVLALSLLTNPFSLLVLLLLFAAWGFLYLFRPADAPSLVLLGRPTSDREALGGLVLLTVFVVFLTSVGSILMSALVVGAGIVGAHGALRVPEDLFLDEQDAGGAATGLLSFLGGATSAAPAVGAPAVAARV